MFCIFLILMISTLSLCRTATTASDLSNSPPSDLSTNGFITLFKRGSHCLSTPCTNDQHCTEKNCINGCDKEIEKCFSNDHTLTLPWYHKNFGKDTTEIVKEKEKKKDSKSSQSSSSQTSPIRTSSSRKNSSRS